MKKLLAFILCLTMAMGTVAFAEEVTGTELNKDVLEGQTTVSLTIRPEDNEFVVVIPASVEVDPATQEGSFDVVLKAGWKLPSSNGLKVKIKEFANGVATGHSSDTGDHHFYLKNENGTKARYSLKLSSKNNGDVGYLDYSAGSEDYWADMDVIRVYKTTANTSDIKATFQVHVYQLPTTPGEYTDTITFGITLN